MAPASSRLARRHRHHAAHSGEGLSDRDDGTLSSSEFTFDRDRNVYVCPANKLLKTTGNVSTDHEVAIVHRGATAAHVH